jgi:hypothetical protein
MRRCVAKVSQDKGVDAAFAICTAAMQKAGYLEPGSRTQTDAGKARARQYAAKKDFKDKEADYERALAQGRAEAAFADHFLAFIEEQYNEAEHD